MSYFLSMNNEVYAVLNAEQRGQEGDVLLALPLDAEKSQTYEGMKSQGRSDADIFREMFPDFPQTPPPDSAEVRIPVSQLTKSQLVRLLEDRLHLSLPSLSKMKKDDLVRLLLVFLKSPPIGPSR
ncbi:hypothetical protein JW916_15140 [Candidatus Sumerlaeota bacterium]|nr:hypothetical protein [Candidatus Sumerlaeota bacterium]